MRSALKISLIAAATLFACGDDTGGDNPADVVDDTPNDASADGSGTSDTSDPDTTDVIDDVVDAMADSTDAADGSGTEDIPVFEQCWDDLAVGESEVFYDGFTKSEGIAFSPSGTLFVTSDSAVWAFNADGERSLFAEVPSALGLAAAGDGLIVASIGASNAPGITDGGVYHVAWDGIVTRLADGIDSPNFVAVMANGDALISDDFDTTIWRVDRDGTVSLPVPEVPSPNGMAYSPDGDTLYVISTFTPRGEVWAFDVDDNGEPVAEGREIARLGNGATGDGMAVDALGRVYVAANIRNRIERIDPATGEVTVVATDLGTPASMAFGRGPGFDPCSVYTTQLFGSEVLRVSLGVPGAPMIVGTDLPSWTGGPCSTFEENACNGEGLCVRTAPLDCSVGYTGVCTAATPACPPVDEPEDLCDCDGNRFGSLCLARLDGQLEFIGLCEPDGSGEGSGEGSGG